MTLKPIRTWIAALALPPVVFIVAMSLSAAGFGSSADDELDFKDVRQTTLKLMDLERRITLSPAQEAIKKAALEPLPAPCCSDNSAYTCCCPCNLTKTIWGLSQYLIAEKGVEDPAQVRAKVEEWLDTINPKGFSGDVCYTAGGCPRPFKENGCGGMNPQQLAF